MPPSIDSLLLLGFLIFLSMLFSLAEAAFMAVSEERVHKLSKDGLASAKDLLSVLKNREKVISVALLCDNVVNILASSLSAVIFSDMFPSGDGLGIAASTAFMTVMIFIFGEIVPKTIGMRKATGLALFMAPFFKIAMKLMHPVISGIDFINRSIIRIFNIQNESDQNNASDSILGAVEMYHQKGTLQTTERQMLNGVLSLEDVDVKDVMTHRGEMFAIDIQNTPNEILKLISSSNYSKVPFYDGNDDNMIGVMHLIDFFIALQKQDGDINKVDIKNLLRESWFIPGEASLISQLTQFKSRGNVLAFVVDEYGGIMGVITLEDILEQIVGDIKDNHEEEEEIKEINETTFVVDADTGLIQFNERLSAHFKDDNVSSIGGLIINKIERIPSVNEEFEIDGYGIKILETEKNRILKIEVTKPKSDSEEDDISK